LKRRETRGRYEDRLSGMLPDPARLSAVSRSPLVRAGSRWLSFARGLTRGRGRRMASADPLGFIESLYGGKFATVEGAAFPLDKVYRTAGGGLFISETRLSVSFHPRFDLRLLNVANVRAGSQVFHGPSATTPLSHAGASARERQSDPWHITHGVTYAPSLTVQTWNESPSAAERHLPSLSYVSVRGDRARQARWSESARPEARVERVAGEEVLTSTGAESSRSAVAPGPASLHLTSLDLRQLVNYAPRQEFVSVLLNTYLPSLVSREVLSLRASGESRDASAGGATAQAAAGSRFVTVMPAGRPSAWTYVGPTTRHAPGTAVEVRREFHSTETLREHATTTTAAAHDQRPQLLNVLPPESLLLSLSETSLTLLTRTAGHTTYELSRPASASSPQLLRTRTSPSGKRESGEAVHAPRRFDQTPPQRPTATRDILSSLRTFAERFHSTAADITHVYHSTLLARPNFEHVSSRQRGTSSYAAPSDITSHSLLSRSLEFVRPASGVEFTREASTHDAPAHDTGTQAAHAVFSTQGVQGMGTFLFATRLLRRTVVGTPAESLSPTAATALRSAAAAEAGRAVREARAARPEGLALELIRHRREQVLPLPQPGYVFTQPTRAQLEERQVITKASREEIVEVVRKEVRSLAASAPAANAPSRADLGGLAEEVYSTLVRRLLVEKERLGRF
jgi:hypothetical protein